MKKVEKYIYLVIIIVLAGVIVSGTTYIVMKDKKIDTNQNEDNGKMQEKITLSDSELEEYLNYVPQDINIEGNVYYQNNVNVDEINKDYLRNVALILASSCLYKDKSTCPFDTTKELIINVEELREAQPIATSYVPLSYVNELLFKMYRYELTDLKNATSMEDVFSTGGMGYIYQDGYFILTGGGDATNMHINFIDDYVATDKELIIYEYATYYDYSKNKMVDYYAKKEVAPLISCGNTTYEERKEILENYLKEHKSEFTKYKHTFKKNDTGYYWYSTEIVE